MTLWLSVVCLLCSSESGSQEWAAADSGGGGRLDRLLDGHLSCDGEGDGDEEVPGQPLLRARAGYWLF